MEKKIIHSTEVPSPIGPYSQAVQVGNIIYCSGQIAIDPSNGELILGNIVDESKQVMENIGALLKAAGIDHSAIFKTSIFLSDMALFSKVNEVYGSYFSKDYPARETVAVKTLPKNVNVEISVTALIS